MPAGRSARDVCHAVLGLSSCMRVADNGWDWAVCEGAPGAVWWWVGGWCFMRDMNPCRPKNISIHGVCVQQTLNSFSTHCELVTASSCLCVSGSPACAQKW